jgi:hypothetical protein
MPFSLICKRNQSQTLSIKQDNLNASLSPTSDTNNKFLYSIYLQRTVQCIFIPCKNMCICSECLQEIRQRLNSVCPICRQIFREIWDVFYETVVLFYRCLRIPYREGRKKHVHLYFFLHR